MIRRPTRPADHWRPGTPKGDIPHDGTVLGINLAAGGALDSPAVPFRTHPDAGEAHRLDPTPAWRPKLPKGSIHGRAFTIAVAHPHVPALLGVGTVADKNEELCHGRLLAPDVLIAERAVPPRLAEDDEMSGAQL